jgi:hypothetical protein
MLSAIGVELFKHPIFQKMALHHQKTRDEKKLLVTVLKFFRATKFLDDLAMPLEILMQAIPMVSVE